MYKWNDDRSLRLQAGYTHELIRQQRGNTQIYYQPTDTIQIDETYHYRLRSDIANLELRYEDNSSRNYISNRFTVDGEINRGCSEELGQTLQTSQLKCRKLLQSYPKPGKRNLGISFDDTVCLPACILTTRRRKK